MNDESLLVLNQIFKFFLKKTMKSVSNIFHNYCVMTFLSEFLLDIC